MKIPQCASKYELKGIHGSDDLRGLPHPSQIFNCFEQFSTDDHFTDRFFVRDNDLKGNNRLYRLNTVVEYRDGVGPPGDFGSFKWEEYRKSHSFPPNSNAPESEESGSNPETSARTNAAKWCRIMYVII